MENTEDNQSDGLKQLIEVCDSAIVKEAEVRYVYAPSDATQYFMDSVPFLFCLSLCESHESKSVDPSLNKSNKGSDSQELFAGFLGDINERSQTSKFLHSLLQGVFIDQTTPQCEENSGPNLVQGVVSLLLESADGIWNKTVGFCARLISRAIISEDVPVSCVTKWMMSPSVGSENQFKFAIDKFVESLLNRYGRTPDDPLGHDHIASESVQELKNTSLNITTRIQVFAALEFLLMKSELRQLSQYDVELKRIIDDNKDFLWGTKTALSLFRYFRRDDLIRVLVLNSATSSEAFLYFTLVNPSSEVCKEILTNILKEETDCVAFPCKALFGPICEHEPKDDERKRADDHCIALAFSIMKEITLLEITCKIPFSSLHLLLNSRSRHLLFSGVNSWLKQEPSTARGVLLKICFNALSQVFYLRLLFELGVLKAQQLFWKSNIEARIREPDSSNNDTTFIILWCFETIINVILEIASEGDPRSSERTAATCLIDSGRLMTNKIGDLTYTECVHTLLIRVAATDLEVDHLVETYLALASDVQKNASIVWRLLKCLLSSKSAAKTSIPPMTRFIDPNLLSQSPKGSERLVLLFNEYVLETQKDDADDSPGWLTFSLLRDFRKNLFEDLLKWENAKPANIRLKDRGSRKYGLSYINGARIDFQIDKSSARKMINDLMHYKNNNNLTGKDPYCTAAVIGILLCLIKRREEAIMFSLKYCIEHQDPSLANFVCSYCLGKRDCPAALTCRQTEIWTNILTQALKVAKEEVEVDRTLAETLCHSLMRPVDVFSLLCQTKGRICSRIQTKMNKLGQSELNLAGVQQLIEGLSADPCSIPASLTVAACTIAVEKVYADESVIIEQFSQIERALSNACQALQTECIQTGKVYYDKCLANLKDESKANSIVISEKALTLSIPHETCDICDQKLLSNTYMESRVKSAKGGVSKLGSDILLEAEERAFRNKVYALQCGHLFHAKCCRTVTIPQMDENTLEIYKNLLKQVFWFSQTSSAENDNSPNSTDPSKHCWTASHINEVYRSIEVLLMARCPLCSPNIINVRDLSANNILLANQCVTSPLIVLSPTSGLVSG